MTGEPLYSPATSAMLLAMTALQRADGEFSDLERLVERLTAQP